MPRLERVQGVTLTNDPTPELLLRVRGVGRATASNISAWVDGAAIDARRIRVSDDGTRMRITAPPLADGAHQMRVEVAHAGVLRHSLREAWTVRIDTRAPSARVREPRRPDADEDAEPSAFVEPGTIVESTQPVAVSVQSEPGVSLIVDSDAAQSMPVRVGPSDRTTRSLRVRLPEGRQSLNVTVADAAGNATRRKLLLTVDSLGPRVAVRVPARTRNARLSLPLVGTDQHGVELSVSLDGAELDAEAVLHVDSTTAAPFATQVADALPVEVRGVLELAEDAPALEGSHRLVIQSRDSLGNVSRIERRLLVDSTETLGEASGLRGGALGADAAQLQRALIDKGVVGRQQIRRELSARVYGPVTTNAVRTFQQREGLEADGVASGETIAALTLQIIIDRSTHTLTLLRAGSVAKRWGVAVGSPQYPTPAGEFHILEMQKNPTWTPPDSAWAADAKPIPPGPDNPLGTRWMAVSGTVGIHGTNSPASIGYSVSHGCIRMAIPDVEELYDLVTIGTPVKIV